MGSAASQEDNVISLSSAPIAGRRTIHLALFFLCGLTTTLFFAWVSVAARPAHQGLTTTPYTAYISFIIKQETRALCGQPALVGGNMEGNVTWSPQNLYVIDRDIVIKPGATLSILPGTVVKFKPGRGIQVEGKLTSDGISSHPVFWTSWNDDQLCGDTNGDGTVTTPQSGDWRWIEFRPGSNPTGSIRNSVIRYGGRSGGYWRAPIRVFNVSPAFENLSITNSHRNAVQLIGGEWTSHTLTSTTVIYWVFEGGDITALPGNLLEINPGVKLKFGDSHGIYVLGALSANGTVDYPIYFSSEKDDTLCGLGTSGEQICDTNDDLTASAPAAGNWKWIEFNKEGDAGSSITNAVFRYGGRNGPHWRAPIRIHNITPVFENLTIEHSHYNAVQLIGGDWTSQTLGSQTVLYWVFDGHINVLAANTLTILPGVKIKWAEGHGMVVRGGLIADGTKDKPIVLTSDKDDAVCGRGVNGEAVCDTNDDATATVPAAGNWVWLHFVPSSDPNSSVTNALISYGGRDGPHWRAPIRIENVSPTFENLTIRHSHRNGVQLIGGGWTTKTLTSQTVVYWRYDYHLDVLAGNTLTILPGVKIKFDYGHGLIVNGKIVANGTQVKPIVFTSETDDTVCGNGVNDEPICDTNDDVAATSPVAGDWQWIAFNSTGDPTSSITNAVFRYGGRDGPYWRAPIRIHNISPTFENLTIEHSHRNGVQLIGGGWTSQTLDSQTVVYWRYDDHLNVLAGNTLTILPGVMIKFHDGHGLIVQGNLQANGTGEKPLAFTSERDDTVCGAGVNGEPICDTNDDTTATVPAQGDWVWIEFRPESSPDSSLTNAVIRYGGRSGSYWRAAVMVVGASPAITNVLFDTNHGSIFFYESGAPQLGCNDIVGNTYGHWNHNPANLIEAEGQWWGSPSGPTHTGNPGGSGQPTSNGIDYQPWATSPCTDFAW